MPLEATVLVLDNSEWMRNGDYVPSRLEAQNDAVNLIFTAKTQSNPENTVSVMTMGGKGPEVLVTLTNDMGKILAALHKIKVSGNSHLSLGIQTAQLVLKNRENKNQRQRIVVFCASPIADDEKNLIKLAKKLKKNNVSVDIINFGQEAENSGKLNAFIEAVNSNDSSHLVTVPPGPHILSDALISTPIVAGEDGAAPGFVGGSGFEFGVDPNLDPELALALRLSMEEERARQESSNPAPKAEPMAVDNEDALLAQALAMSMQNAEPGQQQQQDVQMKDLTEDEQIAQAIQMSMGQSSNIQSALEQLPGVDPNDPRFKDALRKGGKNDQQEKK